jgi:hypothetical protein
MPEGVYVVLDVVLIAATLGLILHLLSRVWLWIRKRRSTGCTRVEVQRFAPWLLVLLWPSLVVALWITWATSTWSSQGRLVFSAISVWSLLLALGWDRLTHTLPKGLQSPTLASVPLLLFTISLCAPFVWIRPAYARPSALTEAQLDGISQRVDAVFFHPAGGQLKLLGYDAPVQAAYPGQSVPVTLYWEAIEPFGRDYSIFLHLVDAHNLVVTQRDALPGMGTLSTQWLDTLRWAEERVLTLPDTAFSPNQTVVEVGLYDYATGERLEVVNADGQIAGDNVRFGQLEIQAQPGEVPNPIAIDFGGEMELVGYDLDRRALQRPESTEGQPGGATTNATESTTTLTLYWRGQRPMATNYSISTQLVDANGVKAAQKDAWPFDGRSPTSLWEPGVVVKEPRELTIFDGTPPGVYDVYVAVYPPDDPGALLVVTPPGGRLQTDHIVLTTVHVLP